MASHQSGGENDGVPTEGGGNAPERASRGPLVASRQDDYRVARLSGACRELAMDLAESRRRLRVAERELAKLRRNPTVDRPSDP